MHTLEHTSEELDMQEQQIKDMFDAGGGTYLCVNIGELTRHVDIWKIPL